MNGSDQQRQAAGGTAEAADAAGSRPAVRSSSLFAAFLSSFGLQAGFNFEGYQNLGIVSMLLPALKDLYPDPQELRSAVRRHLTYFNAHPYLASFAAGALIRAEEDRAAGLEDAMDDVGMRRMRQAMGSMLGNLGDRLFWAGMLPLSALLGVLAFLFDPVLGALCILVVFNIPHLIVRAEGIRLGYQKGRAVFLDLGGPFTESVIRWIRRASGLAAGCLLVLIIAHHRTPAGAEGALLVAVPALLASWLLRRSIPRVLALLVPITLISLYCLLA